MVPRPDVSEERKAQILDTAEEVFASKGFDGANMDLIATNAGLSKGAVYWYFKKKDDIIGALLDRVFRRSLNSLRAIASQQGSPRARLIRIGEQISSDYQGMERLMPIALEFYAIALRRKSIRKHLGGLYDELLSILTPVIEQGIQAGELAPAEPRRAATLLIASYEGLGVVWALSPKLVEWRTHGPLMAEVLVRGLEQR
ncbi:MAG TPA: TetR/AcrR family transcriptional regulator [Terracidiphilus sp.]|nr:TetR/AcrR family transcriptional regulator [Terracidiphilus sp.]